MMQTLWGSAKWIILMISLSRSLNERASKEHSSESAAQLKMESLCSGEQTSSTKVRRTIFLEYGRQRTKAAQVAVLQRLWPRDRQTGKGVVVCAVHLRASSDDGFRVQQASALVSALQDFSRGDEQIILADVNSKQMMGSSRTEIANVFDYFAACGFKCAYTDLRLQHGHSSPKYTTWAGWASGDFKATCDHIFVSKGLHAQAVLDVPDADELAEKFPERLPNEFFPSDHLSLIADLVIPDSRLA